MNESDVEHSSTSTFNMSIATLQRIDEILRGLSANTILHRVPFMREFVFALYKELYPFLTRTDIIDGDKFYNKIKEYTFTIDEHDHTCFVYKRRLIEDINEFEFWIRTRLKKYKLLMSVAEDPSSSLGAS